MTRSYAGDAWIRLGDDIPVHAHLEEYAVPSHALREEWGGTLRGDVGWVELLASTVELRLPNGAVALVTITGVSYPENVSATVVGTDARPF